MAESRDAEIHHLVGGVLCLDFANTLYGHQEPQHEYLFDYRDLVLWSRHAGVLAQVQAGALLEEAGRQPGATARIFQRAIALRETIFRVFSALAQARRPGGEDLDDLHQAWLESHAHSRLAPCGSGYSLGWEPGTACDGLLWPIAGSAVELLTAPYVDRVKQCGRCDWLFLDESRNRSRRWCSMNACGNRVKMARRYRRRKVEGPEPGA